MRATTPLLFTLCTLAAYASSALAGDGVLEINQTCAVSTGCFSGDTAGFPVTIDGTAGRSYRLTSDLNTGSPNLDGIVLETSRLTVDFNGFSLTGPSIGTGTGVGVLGNGAASGLSTLHGGAIRGFRGRGIDLGQSDGVRVEDMVIQFNAGGGIYVGGDAQVLGNRVLDNGAFASAADGIVQLGAGGRIHGNLVAGVPRSGINGRAEGASISDNVVRDFAQTGIVTSDSGNSVQRNTILGDGAPTGISFDNTTNAYRGNIISGVLNTVVSGRDAGGNVCNGSTTCP